MEQMETFVVSGAVLNGERHLRSSAIPAASAPSWSTWGSQEDSERGERLLA